MKHLKRITLQQAQAKDGEEIIFFQLYFTVLAFMISAALGDK
ncbi:MAG TPA: hypothetical protein PKI11_04150 [Candidatus Hydrogenedentes bacterium]|nr:hypothetical protein [Candidatus Hydrogenedentota bacterium]HNT88623.1 hypothetical protein [Candidatus Hydrogenedentota bacterium]